MEAEEGVEVVIIEADGAVAGAAVGGEGGKDEVVGGVEEAENGEEDQG